MSRAGSVKQDESGTWRFVVDISPVGATKRKQVRRRGFATKREAQEALDKLKESVRRGEYVEPSRVTFGDYMTSWLDGLAVSGRSPATIDSYRQKVRLYITDHDVAVVPLQGLTALDLDGLYSELVTKAGRNGTGVSLRTARYVHAIIRKALADAERKGLVTRNVATLASPPAASATRPPEPDVWTPDQLRQFLEQIDGHHHFAMFRLMAMTGVRRAEACGLRWDDVDGDGGKLTVRHTITAVAGERVEGTGKTRNARRTIDVDPVTIGVLRTHRRTQLEQRLLMGSGYVDHGTVFAMPTGEPWNPDVVSRAFTRLVASSGLPRIRLHDLRHTHATHLLAAGTNPKVVSERLGHASVAFTLDVYGHVLDGQQADAAAAVAALVDGFS